MQDQRYLGEVGIGKLVLKFSVPCVLSLLVTALYNIVDQVFIGNSELSTLGNAATGAVFPMFVIAQAFAWWLGDGCAVHLNIAQGRDETKTVDRALGACMTLTLIVSAALLAIFYPVKTQVLSLFGASKNSMNMAIEYFDIILAFFPVFMLSNMFACIIRADGSPAWAMAAILSGAIVNSALDPTFIFGCKMGMRGAAWATGIGQAVSLVVALLYVPQTKTFKFSPKSFIPNIKRGAPATKLGISSFITQMTIVLISVVCNATLAKYGRDSAVGEDIPIAVIGIENKVFAVVINLVVGVVLGCQPIIGYNLGAGNYARVRKLYVVILAYTLAVGVAATLVFELAPRAVVRMFGEPTNIPNPEDYWAFAEKTFRIFLMFITFTATIKMSAIFFQAVGKPAHAVISSLVRDVVCFLPFMLLLPMRWGIDGILYAAPAADAVGMLVCVALTVAYFVSLRKSERASSTD